MAQTADKFIVRFPDGMRDEIAAAAQANGRSMNAEIIARLSGQPGLRDKFAGQAMAGLYAGRGGQSIQERHFGEDARLAYAAADAMLAARKAGA